jgi:outer membrane biosynthesis protein TonB
MDTPRQPRSEIAPDTLLVASIGSATATVVIGRFGLAGTLLGAALFPVVLALAKETARRPGRRLPRSLRRRDRAAAGPDAHGERHEQRGEQPRALRDRLAEVRWRRVLATSAAAFAVVVAAFTLAELAFGGSLVSDRPTTFFSPAEDPAPAPPADEPGAPVPGELPEEDGQPPPEEPGEPPPPEEPPPEPVPEDPPAEESP